MKNLYLLLEIDETATEDDIKKAYRRLARLLHPDATGGDRQKAEQFKEVCAAYAILGVPKKRSAYDAVRKGPSGSSGYGLFGELFNNLVGRIKTEGIRTTNVDSIVEEFFGVAHDLKERIPAQAKRAQESPGELISMLEKMFEEEDLDLADLARGPGSPFKKGSR
jgi:DnaJ-class molecular chaperone